MNRSEHNTRKPSVRTYPLHRATVAIAAALVVTGVAPSPAPAAAGEGHMAAGVPTTRITMKVTGCEGCRFIAHDGRKPAKAWKVVATSDPVVDGRTTIRVPRRHTATTSFEVDHPKGYTGIGGAAFVATGYMRPIESYKGVRVGEVCWGKQAGPRATLNVIVTEYRGRYAPGTPLETGIRARLAKLTHPAQASINGTPVC